MPSTAPRSRRCCASAPRRRRAGPRCPTTCRADAGRAGHDLVPGRRQCRRRWRASPQLEGFRAKGIEVLLLSDPIDAFWPERLDSFEGKPLKSVTQASARARSKDADQPDISPLLAALKKALGDEVADVRATGRLTDSAVVLAAGEQGPDLQMQRLLRRAGRAMLPAAPVLEVNPRHTLIEALAAKAAGRGADRRGRRHAARSGARAGRRPAARSGAICPTRHIAAWIVARLERGYDDGLRCALPILRRRCGACGRRMG